MIPGKEWVTPNEKKKKAFGILEVSRYKAKVRLVDKIVETRFILPGVKRIRCFMI